LSNKSPARKVRNNTKIDSDSETEEMNRDSLAETGEHPESSTSGETTRNKVKIFMSVSDSETEEISHSSVIWKDDSLDAERSVMGGDLNGTSKKKLRNVILDSGSETEEISHSSVIWKGYVPDTKSVTGGSSCGTAKNKVRSVMLNSDSENEVTGSKSEQTKCDSVRVLSGSDSDGDISHSVKGNKTTFSATMATTKRPLEEEIIDSIYVQKHKRRIIVSDDEDD
jgi:hypothetical protein